MIKFTDFQLDEKILKALHELKYETPTPIQAQSIPHLLEGKDLLGCAQTGTGKTAAFALPLLQQVHHKWSAVKPKSASKLILTPTRELAVQIYDNIKQYGKYVDVKACVVYGGVSISPQIRELQKGVDILIATPGRLLDIISQRHLTLSYLNVFVLDEADRMLDMGFIHDIKKIIGMLPQQRQTLFFSATMAPEIQKLAQPLLKNPVKVEVSPEATTAEKVDQKLYYVDRAKKKDLLRHLLQQPGADKVIVFTRTKHGANKVTELLQKNRIPSLAIHGNKSQNARLNALDDFKTGRIRVLIATDVAARGIDIDDVTHVINFEIPNVAESYVHRIGRTARAGRSGIAISLCDAEERSFIRDIEKKINQQIPIERNHPFHSSEVEHSKIISKGKAKELIEQAQKATGGRKLNIGFQKQSKNRFRKR